MIKIGRRGSLSGKIEITGTQGHIAYSSLRQITRYILEGCYLQKA